MKLMIKTAKESETRVEFSLSENDNNTVTLLANGSPLLTFQLRNQKIVMNRQRAQSEYFHRDPRFDRFVATVSELW